MTLVPSTQPQERSVLQGATPHQEYKAVVQETPLAWAGPPPSLAQ